MAFKPITSDVISAWGSAAGDPTFVANWTSENAASQLAVGTTIATHRIENIPFPRPHQERARFRAR